MDEQERTAIADKEIQNIREFALENQDIKLENLPRYEDLITPTTNIDKSEKQDVSNLPFFQERPKVEKVDEKQLVRKARFKIAVSTFAVVGILLFALVLINGVNMAILSKEISDNNKDISNLTEEVQTLSGQEINLDGVDGVVPKGVSYKLALPRNYPNNTADLTWFDKISIFLMKLFG